MRHLLGTKQILLVAGAALLLSGCSLEASIQNLNLNTLSLRDSQLLGFVSSSAQNEKTASGYIVQSSSGDYSNKIEETTNSGYKVYISVQGNIISEQ